MAGYANRVITRQFPELAEDGDSVWVTIRNPRTMPPSELRSKSNVETDAEGKVIETEEAMTAGNEVIAKLIIGWRVYDGSWVPKLDEDTGEPLPGQEQPRLKLPATPQAVAKLPTPIFLWLGEELAKVNPQAPTSDPEGGTGRS